MHCWQFFTICNYSYQTEKASAHRERKCYWAKHSRYSFHEVKANVAHNKEMKMLWNHQKSWYLYFCGICVYNPSSVYLFIHVIWIIMNPSFYTLCIPVRCTSKPTKMNQLRKVDKPWKLIPTNFKDSTVCIQTKHKIIWLAWQDK